MHGDGLWRNGPETRPGGARLPPSGGVGRTRGPGLTRIGASALATSLFRSRASAPVKTLSVFRSALPIANVRRAWRRTSGAGRRSPLVAAGYFLSRPATSCRGPLLLVAYRVRAEALD